MSDEELKDDIPCNDLTCPRDEAFAELITEIAEVFDLEAGALVAEAASASSSTIHQMTGQSLAQNNNLNFAVDLMLMILRKTIRDMGFSTVNFSNVQTTFGPWRGGLFSGSEGWFRNLSSIFRTDDFTADMLPGGVIEIGGSLGLQDLELGFDRYALTYFGYGTGGSLRLRVGVNSISIKISLELDDDTCRFNVVDVRMKQMSNISASVTGFWPFGFFISKLIPAFVYLFWRSITRSIEISIKNVINEAMVKAGLHEEE